VNSETNHITVILDDDPTGTQTVQNIHVLTVWDSASLTAQFQTSESAFFILTNSRARTEEKAFDLLEEIGKNLKEAAGDTGKSYSIILRGDSTLRGHFPAEAYAIEKSVYPFNKWLICPFFEEGGRITENDIHYIKEGDKKIPVSETSFAQDPSFGSQLTRIGA
jgi:uncharacterized protein YgbK (DUF1537 family)